MPFAGVGFAKPDASKQFKRRPSEHEIRCRSENTVAAFNRDYDSTHDMYIQTNSPGAPSPSRRSSNDITISSVRKGEGPPEVPNRSNEEVEFKSQGQAIELLHDGGHGYTIARPRNLTSRRDDSHRDWDARYQG